MKYKCSKTRFLEDVKGHKMTILKDDGLYRHITFSKGSTDQWFEIITWEGNLVIGGDMGSYHFNRITDMFQFFVKEGISFKSKYAINPSYWGEKLQNNGHYEEFCHDKFKEVVQDSLKDFVSNNKPNKEEMLDINEKLEDLLSAETEEHAYLGIRDFPSEYAIFERYGCDLPDFRDYTYRYIWCCYAIVWGILQYNKLKGIK